MGDTQVLVTDITDPNEWGGNAGAIRIRRDGSAAEFTYNPEALHAHPWQPFPGGGGGEIHVLRAWADYPNPAPGPTAIQETQAAPATINGTDFEDWEDIIITIYGGQHTIHTRIYPIAALTAPGTNDATNRGIDQIVEDSTNTLYINWQNSNRTITTRRTAGNLHIAYCAIRR